MKILLVVDMQNDFIDGSLGTKEAQAILPKVIDKVKGFKGEVVYTLDTHFEDYLETQEGKRLPVVHCVKDTKGWEIPGKLMQALIEKNATPVEKLTFGSEYLPEAIEELTDGEMFEIELVGLCTDICVISNAMILKAFFPEAPVTVDSACCAGVTPKSHSNALEAMKMCQITIK